MEETLGPALPALEHWEASGSGVYIEVLEEEQDRGSWIATSKFKQLKYKFSLVLVGTIKECSTISGPLPFTVGEGAPSLQQDSVPYPECLSSRS
jgi:hypothetical protein